MSKPQSAGSNRLSACAGVITPEIARLDPPQGRAGDWAADTPAWTANRSIAWLTGSEGRLKVRVSAAWASGGPDRYYDDRSTDSDVTPQGVGREITAELFPEVRGHRRRHVNQGIPLPEATRTMRRSPLAVLDAASIDLIDPDQRDCELAFAASLNHALTYDSPYRHWTLSDVLPASVAARLDRLPFAAPALDGESGIAGNPQQHPPLHRRGGHRGPPGLRQRRRGVPVRRDRRADRAPHRRPTGRLLPQARIRPGHRRLLAAPPHRPGRQEVHPALLSRPRGPAGPGHRRL